MKILESSIYFHIMQFSAGREKNDIERSHVGFPIGCCTFPTGVYNLLEISILYAGKQPELACFVE